MEIDEKEKVCPICGYEFAGYSTTTRWVAIALVAMVVFYLLYSFL